MGGNHIRLVESVTFHLLVFGLAHSMELLGVEFEFLRLEPHCLVVLQLVRQIFFRAVYLHVHS